MLDEPTSGLDPNQIHDVRALIRQLAQTKTVLLSTHILQEVEAVSDRVVMINEGRIVFDGTPADMAGDEGLEKAFYRLTGKLEPEPEPPPPAAVAEEPQEEAQA